MASRKIRAGLLLGICGAAICCAAVTQRAMSLAELVGRADMILIGTVTHRASEWNPEHTRIYTRTILTIEESFKGAPGRTIVIETPGGVVGGVGMMAPGAATFRVGEKHLLFVSTVPVVGRYRVLGWRQGQYQIIRDPATGRERLRRTLVGVTLVPSAARGTRLDASQTIEYLDDMKLAIRRLQGR